MLGSWGYTSPTYFSSPDDQTRANQWLYDTAARLGPVVQTFVAVNPNFTEHALAEIQQGMERGAVGIKLAAGRRADDVRWWCRQRGQGQKFRRGKGGGWSKATLWQ